MKKEIIFCNKVLWVCSLFLLPIVAEAVVIKPVTTPWLRLNQSPNQMKIDSKAKYLAFVDGDGPGLNILDFSTNQVFKVSNALVGASFFWSPDGVRLFYRAMSKDKKGKVTSELLAYDCVLKKNVSLGKVEQNTGFLTYDPSDLRMHLMQEKGILTKRLSFPDQRLARWQKNPQLKEGKWIATQQGMIWALYNGLEIRKMPDDNSGVESFDISPNGTMVAWATKMGNIYISKNGKTLQTMPNARDPNWHPTKPMLVYAAGRMVGNRTRGYDLRIMELTGKGQFLTNTQHSSERWPRWLPDGNRIVYTKDRSTDLYKLELQPNL